jgi:hypothetical protein
MSYVPSPKYTFRVSSKGGDFVGPAEAIAYLSTQTFTEGARLVCDGGEFLITNTITVDLTMPLKIEGAGTGSTCFCAYTGLLNKNMFVIKSNTDFDGIEFSSDDLSGWESGTNASYIKYDTADVYSEVVNFTMDKCKKGIEITAAASVFAFNYIISNATTGVDVNSTGAPSIDLEVANIVDCDTGIALNAGTLADVYLSGIRFINPAAGIGILYVPTMFTYLNFSILNCEHNHTGTFLSGFDFTLARDADIEVISSIGIEDKIPHAKINTEAGASAQALTSNTWTKSSHTNSSSYTTKWGIGNNKATYLSSHVRDVTMIISLNMSTSTQLAEIRIGVVKNNNTGTVYGRMGITLDVNNRAFSVSTNVYLEEVVKDDYFEIFLYAVGANETVTITDVAWLITAR